MISGISSPDGYPSRLPVTSAKPSSTPSAQTPPPEVHPELHPPEGDDQTLQREFNLFDLATRQFARILPRLELATVPVE